MALPTPPSRPAPPLLALAVLGLALAGAGPAVGADDLRATLAAIEARAPGDGLTVTANEGLDDTLRVGDDVTYHFRAEHDGYLTALYVDSHGVVTVLSPSSVAAGRLEAGQTVSFPSEDLALSVTPPVGPATVFAISTPEPLSRDRLGLPEADDVTVLEAEAAAALGRRISELLDAMSGHDVHVARLQHRVIGRGDTEYTVGDVVAYMGPTRSIQRPKLDVHVRFAFDSSALTPEGEQNLDVVGKALAHSELSDDRFVLGGHTDDLGERTYNEQLSLERARAARDYLVERWQVAPERIEIRGYGEERPLEPGETEEARSLNRRVELELLQ